MVKCSYPVCPNDSLTHPTLTFHKFPNRTTNKPVWEAWISVLSQAKRRELSKKGDELVICNNHFVAADFSHQRNSLPVISPFAVPIGPSSRSVSFCDLESNVQSSTPSLKQGTLFKFIADRKPKLRALTPFLIKPTSKEGEIEDIATSPPAAVSTTSPTPIMSPMSANIDDISPFAIMSNQAEEIALSNVDDSVNVNSSKGAWGDKSNSPKNKGKDKIDKKREQVREEEQEDSLTKYALSAADKPINLCECCLCCFRIQTLEEIVSLYNHVKTKHEGECTCAVCDIKFKDVYTLMLHVAEFHRANKCFKCKNCRRSFNHHADLSKHLDFCYLSSDSEDLEDLEESPVNSPRKKKTKFEKGPPGMPELVSTLKSTQNTLDKIKTFITSESSPYEDL